MIWDNEEAMFNVAPSILYGDENAPVDCANTGDGTHDCDCEVEPDGHCEHGCPSILLVLGVI